MYHNTSKGDTMPTIFGTDGIRDTYGNNWLTPTGLRAIGHAVATWAQHQERYPTIAVGSDTRASRHAIKAQLFSSLSLYPVTIIDYGVIPTPALIRFAYDYNHTCGIMITASHNPPHENGIKMCTSSGSKISDADEAWIEEHVHHACSHPASYEHASAVFDHACFASISYVHDGHALYRDMLAHACCPDLRGTHILIDTACGATHHIAYDIFRLSGAYVETVAPEPDGYNINAGYGSMHPEHLQAYMHSKKADLGFAFDGDGDRVIAVNQHGNVKDGDDILAILSTHPTYQKTSYVIGTHMSNTGLYDTLQQQGIKLVRTNVGDKHIMQAAKTYNAHLAGEPSGHILLSDLHVTGDGILAALRLCQTCCIQSNVVMQSFDRYAQVTYNIPVSSRPSLKNGFIHDMLTEHEQRIAGRIHARYSGTEPMLRLMIETKDRKEAYQVGHNIQKKIVDIIG